MNNYILEDDNIVIGNNDLFISKKYNFINPAFYLITNNKKSEISKIEKISDTVYKLNIIIFKKSNYSLLIIDNNQEIVLNLKFLDTTKYDEISTKNIENLRIETIYKKDKIYLKIRNDIVSKKDIYLKIEGDINKNILWRANLKDIEITFPYKIKGFCILTFKVNNVIKKVKVYNLDDFPKNIIKIKDGLKLNKVCDFDLRVVSNTSEWIIKKGETMLYLDLSKHEVFKIFIEDFLLFEQKIPFQNFLPELIILNNPTRIKISQPFHEEVSIKFKNKKDIYIIPQGKTETLLNLEKGLRFLEIDEIKNAFYKNLNEIIEIK
jgi:hypothetical protein